jgi:hypothetical protein
MYVCMYLLRAERATVTSVFVSQLTRAIQRDFELQKQVAISEPGGDGI